MKSTTIERITLCKRFRDEVYYFDVEKAVDTFWRNYASTEITKMQITQGGHEARIKVLEQQMKKDDPEDEYYPYTDLIIKYDWAFYLILGLITFTLYAT